MRIAVNGHPTLTGDYFPSGNSNAALATMAASLLVETPTTLKHVPDTVRTQQFITVATALGSQVEFTDQTLTIQTPELTSNKLNYDVSRRVPASTLFLAPIMVRQGSFVLEWDSDLDRIRTHLTAMADLGFDLHIDEETNIITGYPQQYEEQSLILTEASVTATSLVCMLAAFFGKKTTIYNAASEPHLRILQHQLVKFGAKIEGIGSNLLTIFGREPDSKPVELSLPSDHIEIASIAAMSALTPGTLNIRNIDYQDLQMILKVFQRIGVRYVLRTEDDGSRTLTVPEQMDLKPIASDLTVDTSPWPNFPSDLIAVVTVLATQANATTLVHEKLYSNRMIFIDKIKAMGAQIVLCDPHRAIVVGPSSLQSEYIDTPDIRIGLSMLLAAFCAEGETVIDNAEDFNYAFDHVIDKLNAVGAGVRILSE